MIYLDHAAATPVNRKALQAMLPYFDEQFFNPSAPYLPAKRVREAYEAAKDELAHVIGAKGVDLVMTAGATESINLAFTAVDGKILTLETEHAAVLEAAKLHQHELVKVDKNGLIILDDLRQKLDNKVELISVSLANNELGTIQPLAEIAEIVRNERQKRLQQGISTPLYLHSDASQALNLIDISVVRLGADLLTINAAKCGGPKGVGALYVAHGVKLKPISVGGGQERGLRSGTENVAGTIGFAVAAMESKSHLAGSRKKYQAMAKILRQELSQLDSDAISQSSQEIPSSSAPGTTKTPATEQSSALHTSIVAHNTKNVKHKRKKSLQFDAKTAQIPHFSIKTLQNQQASVIFLGNPKHQLANYIPVCFPGIDAERLIYRLEQRGVLVSTGAACAANKGSKSHVLAAIGLSDAEIAGSLRISLGSTNTIENITEAARVIREEVERERARIGQKMHSFADFNSSMHFCDRARIGQKQHQPSKVSNQSHASTFGQSCTLSQKPTSGERHV